MRYPALILVFIAAFVPVALGADDTQKQKPPVDPDAATVKKEILQRLEKHFKSIVTVQARFKQEKKLAMFKHTLKIEGQIAIQNPGRMAWRVVKPVRYNMVLIGPKLTQWDEDTDEVQTLRLDGNATFKVAFERLTAWFSGNYASLRSHYDITLEKRTPVVMVFSPKKGAEMEKIIKDVRVVFRKDERYIQEMTIREGGGDTTRIQFLDTRLNKPIQDDVWKVRPGD